MRIKGNQKTLHARLKALPWSQVPEAARVRSVGHGRVETRTIRVIDLAGSTDGHGDLLPRRPPGAEDHPSWRHRHGRWSVQTVDAITSLNGHTNIAAGLREQARTPLLPLATLGLA